MTNPKHNQSKAGELDKLSYSFKHDFNHIADGRILVEPQELARYMLEYRRITLASYKHVSEIEALLNRYFDEMYDIDEAWDRYHGDMTYRQFARQKLGLKPESEVR